jgi:transporter family protein
MNWFTASLLVIVLWGVVGVLQKIGSNHSTSNSLFLWTTLGYIAIVPLLMSNSQIFHLPKTSLIFGLLSGLTNGLGAWCLYSALERGAPASVAVPLTALNPLITIILAFAFLHERLTSAQIAGVTLAIIAAVLLSYEVQPAHPPANRSGSREKP